MLLLQAEAGRSRMGTLLSLVEQEQRLLHEIEGTNVALQVRIPTSSGILKSTECCSVQSIPRGIEGKRLCTQELRGSRGALSTSANRSLKSMPLTNITNTINTAEDQPHGPRIKAKGHIQVRTLCTSFLWREAPSMSMKAIISFPQGSTVRRLVMASGTGCGAVLQLPEHASSQSCWTTRCIYTARRSASQILEAS